jgi:hypothetical protein
MNTLGAMALAASNVELFARPPRRSKRRVERRRPSIVREILDGLARAANEPAIFIPPVRQYPY